MAKSDIGTITIVLEAISAGFDKGVKQATVSIGKFEGRMKATGLAFTEFQNKIGVVSGAFELLSKAATGVAAAVKGDWDQVRESIRALPFGIGAAAAAMDDFMQYMLGTADAAKEVENRLAAIEKHSDRMAKVKKQSWALFETGKEWKERDRFESAFPETDDPNRERFKAQQQRHAATIEALKESERAMWNSLADDSLDIPPETIKDEHKKNVKSINRRSTEAKAAINAYFDKKVAEFEAAQIDESDRVTLGLWLESSRDDMEDITRATAQQADIMKALGADAENVLSSRLAGEAEIVDAMREQLKILEHAAQNVKSDEFRAEIEIDAEQLRREISQADEDIKHAAQVGLVQGLTDSITEAESRLDKLKSKPPTVKSSTFQTAIGTFTMPDRDATNRVRQNQLVAQQNIVSEIQGLRRDLKTAANTHP
tara:strand:- start:6067 stop:7350 length:1284 start_codon:yes stop_codon:yes gene_type:complete